MGVWTFYFSDNIHKAFYITTGFCIITCSLNTILKIAKGAGPLLKPNIPILVVALLEALTGLEPQALNYISLRISDSQASQDRVRFVWFS